MSDETKTPRKKFSPTIVRLGLVSFFTDVASDLIVPLMPLFLVGTLGASNAFVGLVDGTADAVSSLFKVLSGRVSDKRGKRRPLVVAGYTIATVVRPLIAFATMPWHVLGIRITYRVGKGMRTAPRDAWIASVSEPADRARAYGFHRAMDNAGTCLGPLLGLILYKGFDLPLRIVFACSAIPGFIAMVILLSTREAPEPALAVSVTTPAAKKAIPRALKLFFVVLFLFTLANASDSFIILQASALGASESQILMLWTGFAALRAILNTPGALLSDKLGRRHTLFLGWFLFALVFAAFAFVTTVWMLALVLVAYAVYYAITEGTERAFIADIAPAESRGYAFGIFHGTIGLGALPASLLFGLVSDLESLRVAFCVSAALAMLASLLLLLVIRSTTRPNNG